MVLPCGQCYHQKVFKTITWLPSAYWNSPEPSRTFRSLPPQHTPARTVTLRNLLELRNSTHRNQHQHTSELSGTFQNLPPEPRPAHAQELSGTFRNLHQHTPEPTPAHAGTFANLPESASGTYTSMHRNSPEPSGTFLRNLLLRPEPAHTGAYLG